MANDFPVLKVGSKGEDVRTVQRLVTHHGHPAADDGLFGPMTAQAVKDFQTAKGLTVDGIVGNQTWGALLVDVAPGASGSAAKAAQGQLRTQG
ncbi:MAG: peptidoglycan-binding domain-containing protein, partial [Acidimicrobiales bacterium]